jgi:hypothetical protein
MSTPPSIEDIETIKQEPGALLDILQFVQEDHESIEQIRKIALQYYQGNRGSGLCRKAIIDIVGQDGTHHELSYDAHPTLKIVRHILQTWLAPSSVMEDISAFLNIKELAAEDYTTKVFVRLEALEDGWKDGEGRAPTAEALATLKAMLKTVPSTQYAIFPMLCGGIQMETDASLAAVEFRIQASGEIIAEVI